MLKLQVRSERRPKLPDAMVLADAAGLPHGGEISFATGPLAGRSARRGLRAPGHAKLASMQAVATARPDEGTEPLASRHRLGCGYL